MNEVEVVIKGKDETSTAFKSATKSSKELGDGFERTGEKADKAEQRTLGLKDTIDGTATIMQGPGKAGIAAYVQGWADLAGGLANFVIPALGAFRLSNIKAVASTVASNIAQRAAAVASKAWAAAQWLVNAALNANPILIVVTVVAALVAAIILAYKHSETFRAVVQRAGSIIVGVFRSILGVVQGVVGWVRQHWPLMLAILTGPIGVAVYFIVGHLGQIVSFVKSLPGRVRAAAANMFKGVTDAVAGAVSWAIGRLESLMSYVAGIPGRIKNTIGNAISNVAGFFNPFAHGGVVGGAATGGVRSGLTMVGERGAELLELPPGTRVRQGGAGPSGVRSGPGAAVVVELRVTGDSDDLLVKWLRKQIRTGVITT